MASPYYNSPETWGRYGEDVHRLPTDDSSNPDTCITWISGESKKITAAFPRPSKSSRPVPCRGPGDYSPGEWHDEDSDDGSGIVVVRPLHKRPEDVISCFTTLGDAGSAMPVFAPHQPSQGGQLGGTWEPGDQDGGNNDGGNINNGGNHNGGNQENANFYNWDNPSVFGATDQTWGINETGHLIVFPSLADLLTTLKLAPYAPRTEEILLLELHQSSAVARFCAEDRQLEALRLALQFALTALLGRRDELDVVATVKLRDRSPYPTVNLLLSGEWRPDTELQRYLAYYLLREMLKRYRHQPFPDRLDVWEFSFAGDRLLLPYGQQSGSGEPQNVRRRIVEELILEGPQGGDGFPMERLLPPGDGPVPPVALDDELVSPLVLDEQDLAADPGWGNDWADLVD
ncbi:hypothetical protein F5B21DRAFT_529160 [Xylaria acuta]|nr:hypothetical protein F5B21DRAFT_529160 [Xylaria acuta]